MKNFDHISLDDYLAPDGLRVLHVVESALGGVRRYLENLSTIFLEQGWHGGLVYSPTRMDDQFVTLLERMKSQSWALYELPMLRNVSILRDIKDMRRLRSAIRHFKPQIVHCHSSKAGALGRLATFEAVGRGPAVVYSPHSIAEFLGRRYVLIERLLGRVHTDGIIAVSHAEADRIVQLDVVSRKKVKVVSPFIDPNEYAPIESVEARRGLGWADHDKVILGIGRMSPQKDPLGFLKVIAKVAKADPEVRAVWVGDGELRREFEDLAKELEIDKLVRVMGWQTDTRPFVAGATLVLITSRYEGWPYTVAECLAMARPVVATRVESTFEIGGNPTKDFSFDWGDWNAGAEKTLKLLHLPADECKKLEAAGAGRIRTLYTSASTTKSLISAYEAALNGR